MFIILPGVVMCSTLTPPAEVSAIHYTAPYANTPCTESPHPDDDYLEGHLWVNSITGGPNELSLAPQVNFVTPTWTPSRKPDYPPDFSPRVKVQTRALGQPHRAPSKMRGRS